MLKKLKRPLQYLLDPPWEPKGPHPLTMAVPDAQSTFKRGAVGWANRPPARLGCPSCGTEFVHRHGNDVIRCPTCPFERPPKGFADLELVELQCPDCSHALEYGIRHPNLFDVPQWAACPSCQYHWEFSHWFAKK